MFESSISYTELPDALTGKTSLEDFKHITEASEEIEKLRNVGLKDEDLQLYLDLQKGESFVHKKYKNCDLPALEQRIQFIREKTSFEEKRQIRY